MQALQCEIKELKNYEKSTWESGLCQGLAEIRCMGDTACWDNCGCTNIINFLRLERRAGVTDGIIKLLTLIRQITLSVMDAESFLIDQSKISFDIDKLWIDTKTGRVKLLPGFRNEDEYITRICKLLFSLSKETKIACEDIALRIEERNRQSALSYKELLRFLSSWELELR